MHRFGVWLTAVFAAVSLVLVGQLVIPATATIQVLCKGVTTADVAKCNPGYAKEMGKMHWRMYAGHNCVNYVAYQLGINGVPEPKILMGNARDWTANAKKLGYTVNTTPAPGSVGTWGSSKNHVTYVVEVGDGFIITQEDNYPGYYPKGIYQKLKIYKGDSSYPTQFIHFKDLMKSAVPTIAGQARVGSTLTASAGTWTPAAIALAYKWSRNGTAIPGATEATYPVKAEDVDAALTVSVTGTKTGFASKTETSAPTPAVAPGSIGVLGMPSLSGDVKVGSALTVHAGSWAPSDVSITRRWLRDGVVIPGVTGGSYQLTDADLGKRISAEITGGKPGYSSRSAMTSPTAPVGPDRVDNSTPPVITGMPKVGSTLTASEGSWVEESVSFTFQWLVGGVVIPGATDEEFVPTTAQVGKPLTVRVTARKGGFAPKSVDSRPTANVSAGSTPTPTPTPKPTPTPTPVVANSKAPAIDGEAVAGTWISAVNGSWSPSGVSFTYQWYRSGKAVSGGTRNVYKLTGADLGKTVAFKITGTKAGHKPFTAKSKPTAVVVAPLIVNSVAPTISGRSTVGTWIKVLPGTWSPSGVTFTYQWYRSGKAVAGGTRNVYKLTGADRGKSVAVKVTGIRTGFPTLSRTSKPTPTVK